MWGDHKISWKKGSPNATGRGAVQSNNEILPELDFQQKRFQGGYAKRFGEWNRVVYNPVVEEIEVPEIEIKKEGWLFVCGYTKYTTSWGETTDFKLLSYFSGELEYDAVGDIFKDKWFPATAWTLSDSIVSRRLSENLKNVGKTFVDANGISNNYSISIVNKRYGIINACSVYPRGFPYVKRFEYQSLTKSSLDQTSIYKRSTEYYSKIFTELYEIPRQNLDDLYNSLESYEEENQNDSTGRCPNCGTYYSSNQDVEDLMADPESLINRNISAYNFILHSIDHDENKNVKNQESQYYVNLEEFNARPMAATLNYYLDRDANVYKLFGGSSKGLFTFREVYYGTSEQHKYGKSTLIENSDITKYDYDWRIYYDLTANFLGYDINNIITSTGRKNLIEEYNNPIFFAYTKKDGKDSVITLKDYCQKNKFGYHSYFNIFNSSAPGIIKNKNVLLIGNAKELVYNIPNIIKPPTIIEETKYYDPNAVTFHTCKSKNPYGENGVGQGGISGSGSAFTTVVYSGNIKRLAYKACPEKDTCLMWRHDISGTGHTYTAPGGVYVLGSSDFGSDYNNKSYSKAGVGGDNSIDGTDYSIETETKTYDPDESLLNQYEEQQSGEEDFLTTSGSNDVFLSPVCGGNYWDNSSLNRKYYIPKTFYSTRIYLKDGVSKQVVSNKYEGTYIKYSESYEITGTDIEGYQIKKTIKKLAEEKKKKDEEGNAQTFLVDDEGNPISEGYDYGQMPHKIIGATLYVPKITFKQIYSSDGTSREEIDKIEYIPAETMEDVEGGAIIENGWTSDAIDTPNKTYFNTYNSNIQTGYSSQIQYDYVRKKGRPYDITDFPPIGGLLCGFFVDFLSSAAAAAIEKEYNAWSFLRFTEYVYYEYPTEKDENTPDLFDKQSDEYSNNKGYSGSSSDGSRSYDQLVYGLSAHPGTSWFAFPCNSSFSDEGKMLIPSWGLWWQQLGCPTGDFVAVPGSGIELAGTDEYGNPIYGFGGKNTGASSDYYTPNEDLKKDDNVKNLISRYGGGISSEIYFFGFNSTPGLYNVSRFLLANKNTYFLDANLQPKSMFNDQSAYYHDCNFILAPWEISQVTYLGCCPDGEDENGIKYNNKYFIFSKESADPTDNEPSMQNRFHKTGTAYKNFLIEGVYPNGEDDSFSMVNAWMTDIEEGFSGIELKVNEFTNLANGKCTTGFNMPCDSAMISKVSLKDLSTFKYANIFTQDDSNGYTTNKGVFPILKSLWQERKSKEKYGSKKAIFAIETQCMIEGPEYFFSTSENTLPAGFEAGYIGYKSRGLLISVMANGEFENIFISEEIGFFDYFKPQKEKRHPINARCAHDDDPEDLRNEEGYYWDFEEAFGPYEIGSTYTFETQLAGKMSFAVTLGDYTTHILLMLAYDIDKWPTSAEDTPSEYEHPEIKPEEEYLFKSAFLTADLSVTKPPRIPHPFKDFQMRHAIHPLATSSTWTTSKLKDAGRKFFKDDLVDKDEGYKGTGKEYKGITVPNSYRGKVWGERVQYEYNEKVKSLDITRGVVRLIRWRNFTWREKKLDRKGNPVTKDGKQQWIEHQDALAECAVSYTMDSSEYVDLFYTGKKTVFLRFYKDDSKLVKKKKAGELFEGDDKEYKNVETCEGDVCIENLRLPEQMVWLKKTGEGETATFKEYLLKLTGLGIFDIVTLYQASKEEEDPDSSFEVVTIPVMADDGKTYFCVSKDCKNWEISGVIGEGFLSHTAAGEKGAVSEVIEENTK